MAERIARLNDDASALRPPQADQPGIADDQLPTARYTAQGERLIGDGVTFSGRIISTSRSQAPEGRRTPVASC